MTSDDYAVYLLRDPLRFETWLLHVSQSVGQKLRNRLVENLAIGWL